MRAGSNLDDEGPLFRGARHLFWRTPQKCWLQYEWSGNFSGTYAWLLFSTSLLNPNSIDLSAYHHHHHRWPTWYFLTTPLLFKTNANNKPKWKTRRQGVLFCHAISHQKEATVQFNIIHNRRMRQLQEPNTPCKFQFDQDREYAWKPANTDVTSSINIENYLCICHCWYILKR